MLSRYTIEDCDDPEDAADGNGVGAVVCAQSGDQYKASFAATYKVLFNVLASAKFSQLCILLLPKRRALRGRPAELRYFTQAYRIPPCHPSLLPLLQLGEVRPHVTVHHQRDNESLPHRPFLCGGRWSYTVGATHGVGAA